MGVYIPYENVDGNNDAVKRWYLYHGTASAYSIDFHTFSNSLTIIIVTTQLQHLLAHTIK